MEIAEAARPRFPRLGRVTPRVAAVFRRKPGADWRRIAAPGVTRIHSGLESGDVATLAAIHKGVTPEDTIEAYHHVVDATVQLSVYVIIGFADLRRSREHALESARLLDAAPPRFVHLRTLVPKAGAPWHGRWGAGAVTLLSAHQVLQETRRLVERLTGPTTLLR